MLVFLDGQDFSDFMQEMLAMMDGVKSEVISFPSVNLRGS